MRKLLTFLIALGSIVFAVVSPVSANRVLFLAGPKPAATYTGPGDIQTFASWYSCAFVYNAASASTSTNMCDLVAVTGGAAVCTLEAQRLERLTRAPIALAVLRRLPPALPLLAGLALLRRLMIKPVAGDL